MLCIGPESFITVSIPLIEVGSGALFYLKYMVYRPALVINHWKLAQICIVTLHIFRGASQMSLAPILCYRSFKAKEFFISSRPGGVTGGTLESLEGGHTT